MFTAGCDYTRDEIHRQVGGSKVSCLPTVDGMVVAACLLTRLSPQAPAVVLCGQGVRTGPTSRLFARQQGALPVFIKQAAHRWRYHGLFRVEQSFASGARFESFIEGSGRAVSSVSHVVLMTPAASQEQNPPLPGNLRPDAKRR